MRGEEFRGRASYRFVSILKHHLYGGRGSKTSLVAVRPDDAQGSRVHNQFGNWRQMGLGFCPLEYANSILLLLSGVTSATNVNPCPGGKGNGEFKEPAPIAYASPQPWEVSRKTT